MEPQDDKITIGNTIIFRSHVCAIMEEKDETLILLDSGDTLRFSGEDAIEVWRVFGDRDWR